MLPRQQIRRIVLTAAAETEAPASPEPEDKPQQKTEYTFNMVNEPAAAFKYTAAMDPMQSALAAVPLMLFYPAALGAVAAAGLGGYAAGSAMPVDPDNREVTSIATAAVAGAAAAFAALQAKRKRDSASVVELYNAIVELPEPHLLTQDIVDDVGSKYGIDMRKTELDGLQRIYSNYLESVIPTGKTQLKGCEGDNVRAFKDALGLSDEDAALPHIDVANRLFYVGLESRNKLQQFEQRLGFQRLIYVSQMVFGDQKASYLLPWRRVFGLNESQLIVARRDNARFIFKRAFEEGGGELKADRHFLRELRDRQLAVKMFDESAVDVIREYARKHVEEHVLNALTAIKAPGKNKDIPKAMEEMAYVLQYSSAMAQMANEEDLIPGLGAVTIQGGDLLMAGKNTRDVKDLFKAWLQAKVTEAREITPELDAEATQLVAILNLTSKDTNAVRDDVSLSLYRELLRDEVTSRRIDEAESPAAVLEQLVIQSHIRPDAAAKLHEELFLQKLETLKDKAVLTEQDNADIARVIRVLCIPGEAASRVQLSTTGKVLEDAIKSVFAGGARPLVDEDLNGVATVAKDMNLSSNVAIEVLSNAARERFRTYVASAKKETDQREAAGHLKKMLRFNQLVVTPLLYKLAGMPQPGTETKPAAADTPEAAVASTVGQVAAAIGKNRDVLAVDETPRSQTFIGLKEDMTEAQRAEVYKGFVIATMSGNSGGGEKDIGLGSFRARAKTDPKTQEAEQARTGQLAQLLGMTQEEVMASQRTLAEEAYQRVAKDTMSRGPLDAEKTAYLENLRGQFGIDKENGDRIVRAAKAEMYGKSMVAREDGARWDLARVKEVAAAGGNLETLVEENARRAIFRKELEARITDGSGDLDADFIQKQLPGMLALSDKTTRPVVRELVDSRRRMLLVQAISQTRQKRPREAVVSCQNLVSCLAAMPVKESMAWAERAEIRDIFQAYCGSEASEAKRMVLANAVGLSADEVAELACASDSESGDGSEAGDEGMF